VIDVRWDEVLRSIPPAVNIRYSRQDPMKKNKRSRFNLPRKEDKGSREESE
jgi:hypothetical protein